MTNRVRIFIFAGVVLFFVSSGLIGLRILQAPKSDLFLPSGSAKGTRGYVSQEMRSAYIKNHAGLSAGHFLFKNKIVLAVVMCVVTLLVVFAIIRLIYLYSGPTQNADPVELPVLDVKAPSPPALYLIVVGAALALVIGLGIVLCCCTPQGKGILSKISSVDFGKKAFSVHPVPTMTDDDYLQLCVDRCLIVEAIICDSATVPNYPLLRAFQAVSKLIAQKDYKYGNATLYTGFFVPQRNDGESAFSLLNLLKDGKSNINDLQLIHVPVPDSPRDDDYGIIPCLEIAVDIVKREMVQFIKSLLFLVDALKDAIVPLDPKNASGHYCVNGIVNWHTPLDKKYFLHDMYRQLGYPRCFPILPSHKGLPMPIERLRESVSSNLKLFHVNVENLELMPMSELSGLFKIAITFYFWFNDYSRSLSHPTI